MRYSNILQRRGPLALCECTDGNGNPSHMPNRWFTVKLKKRKYPDWTAARYYRHYSEAMEAMKQ